MRKVLAWLKWIIAILLILCVVIYFLNQGIKSKYMGFHRLDKDSIDYIMIYKYDYHLINNHHLDSLMFSKTQINSFIKKWNNSYPIGPCKYIPTYTLTVKNKNGQLRDFRIVGIIIKEKNDFGYKLPFGDNFFKIIWNGK
jgi:hypothetical protein